jgi:H+/Cl- antiporter ClcA
MNKFLQSAYQRIDQFSIFVYLLKWLGIALVVGSLAGTASAIFLHSLEWATNWRESHLWIIALLPIGGLIVGLSYHYFGTSVVKGNNQLLEEFHSPRKVIPFRMAPLVLFGTIVTHFFGGSAGREGTAVQMGGAIADQFTKVLRLNNRDRKILIVMGISAGFASVFGTPLAGAVFALEVLILGRLRYEAILPSFLAATVADYTCTAWHVHHTHYSIPEVPTLSPQNLFWTLLVGILFGLAATAFSKSTQFWIQLFRQKIHYPPLRPVVGGIFIALSVWVFGTTKYIGLGVPTIVESFGTQSAPYDFALKTLLTTFTLGSGFKGGEVTPLFYVGATLGSSLAWLVPLPVALLAGMGFVAVFSGATNTPLACTFMGVELFGSQAGLYIGLACVLAYLFSGHSGIYSAQIIGSPKNIFFIREKSLTLSEAAEKRKKQRENITENKKND